MTAALPIISIVLPTYNGQTYLSQSIQSCVDQTFPHWELVIVDDCSSDQTPRIIEQWKRRDSRIVNLRHLQNRRLPAALNTGFAAARGQYFTWTSDDNAYQPQALEKMLALLKSRPDAALVYARQTIIDADGQPVACHLNGAPRELIFRNCVNACFLYPRWAAGKIGGYDEALCLLEDWDYWLRLGCQGPILELPEDLYLYRWHPKSLSEVHRDRIFEVWQRMIAKNLPSLTWINRSDRARICLTLFDIARAHNHPQQARRYFRQAFDLAPAAAVCAWRRSHHWTLADLQRNLAQRLRRILLRTPLLWKLAQSK